MAYGPVFTDTFSGYASLAGMSELWTSVGSLTGFEAGNGGTGNAVIAPINAVKTIALSNGWIVSVCCKFPSPGSSNEILRLRDTNGLLDIALTRLPSGFLQLTGASGFTTTTDGAVAISGGSAYHKFDLGFFYANSGGNGRVEVRADGARINSLTSSAFAGGAIAGFSIGGGVLAPTSVVLGAGAASPTYDAIGVQHDSALWADTSGVPWIGNRSKFVLYPNGDGTFVAGSNWVAQFAPTVHDAIDETPGDQDATYINNNTGVAGTNADRCSWTMQDLPANTTGVSWVAHTMQVRAAPTGTTAKLKSLLYNGTESDGAEVTLPLDGSYTRMQTNYANVPGGSGWTKAQVNAIEGGVLLTGLA